MQIIYKFSSVFTQTNGQTLKPNTAQYGCDAWKKIDSYAVGV